MKKGQSPLYFSKPFLVIAHRGASFAAPENTFAAFTLAARMKADMIELDVQLSADGIPVVFHDDHLDDRTDGTGLISDLEFRELKELDAGAWYSADFAGERIPALDEVLKWAKDRILLNIEIKTAKAETEALTRAKPITTVLETREPCTEKKVLELIRKYEMEHQVVISSFSYPVLRRIRNADKNLPTAVLYNPHISENSSPPELVRMLGAHAFHCCKEQITRTGAAQLKDEKIPFLIYTVNDPAEMNELIGMGAAGIFTDKPDLLRRVSGAHHK